ncbi:MAG: hypothetical protein E6J15_10085 [Chloroflexi bacterium]|nr:MAG: hypothetical protein E6J15_10085 [Chloroflexota bacterium]
MTGRRANIATGMKGLVLGCVVLSTAILAACGGGSGSGLNETAADALNRGLQAHSAGKLD